MFCFFVVILLSLKPRPFVQSLSVLRYACGPTCFFLFFLSFGDVAFSEYFCTITAFSLYGEYVARFPLPDGVFLPCDHGLDF